MDELEAKRAIQKATHAQQVIDSTKEAWAELHVELWEMWKSTKSDDSDKREEIFREYHAGKALQTKLVRVVNEGKKAEEELKQQKVKHGNRSGT